MGENESTNSNDILWDIRDYLNDNNKTLKDIFKDFDEDANKKISVEEFRNGLLKLEIANMTKDAVDNLVKTLDENDDGEINLKEFKLAYNDDNLPSKIVNPEDFSNASSEYTSVIIPIIVILLIVYFLIYNFY